MGTVPTSGVMVALTAAVEDQANVVVWPQSIELGDTDIVTVGGDESMVGGEESRIACGSVLKVMMAPSSRNSKCSPIIATG